MFLFGLILIIVILILHTVNLILIAIKNYKKKFARADITPMQMWFVNPSETGNYNLSKFVEDYYSKK